jgi:hypothetical protein
VIKPKTRRVHRQAKDSLLMSGDGLPGDSFRESISVDTLDRTTEKPAGNTGRVAFPTQKFEFVPKTAAVSHRMKGFCCHVPDNL